MSGVAGVAGLTWLNIYGLHAWGDGFMMVVVTLVRCPRRRARVFGGCVAARCDEDSTLCLLLDATQIDLGGGGWVVMMVCVVDK